MTEKFTKQLFHILFCLAAITSCSILKRPPSSVDIATRITELPIDFKNELINQNSEIRFNEHMVPYIISDDDQDAAYLLGIAHAHLRGFQLELLRRASQGRLSESLGPFARDFDHALRIFDFAKASKKIEASMPTKTKVWLESFVRGLNKRSLAKPYPFEFAALGIKPTPWTVQELITMSRLLGADVNWISWIRSLRSSTSDLDWKLESSLNREQSLTWQMLQKLFLEITKSGSNSWVIAPTKTQNKAPLIANDPHVGTIYPNLWLLVGLKSPSFHVVGITLPGIPFVLLGRNPEISWGGTNMRALSTEFYDISSLPDSEISTSNQTIKVRGWFDKKITIRETKFGPVLSDSNLFHGKQKSKKPFSVKWVGHDPSDEFTAFYRMNGAKNFREFRSAFATYGVSAQNFVFADRNGNIGHLLAMKKPKRPNPRPDRVLIPAVEANLWVGYEPSTELPYEFNPKKNFIASANDRPKFAPSDLGRVFSPSDRVDRIATLVNKAQAPLTIKDMNAWQRDVHSPLSLIAAKHFIEVFEPQARSYTEVKAMEALKNWNGDYDADSTGALIYTAIEAKYLNHWAAQQVPSSEVKKLIDSSRIREIFVASLQDKGPYSKLPDDVVAKIWSELFKNDLKKFKTWGEKHSENINHPFAALPIFSSRYRVYSAPAPGSFDTLYKRAHAIAEGPTPTRYGATARHISDLSNPDPKLALMFLKVFHS
jgi:penicillin G amidase